jgi:hypothetical protein
MMLGLIDIAIALLVLATSIPLLKDKVKMNHWYGIRWPRKAFESEENWYRINRYGGRRLILWSVVLIFIGILTIVVPVGDKAVPLLICAPLIYLIPLIECWLFAKRL